VPKLFGPIRERYASRPGGYTRVLRVEPLKEDQAESAILELVDGPRDLRFAMTAKTLANIPKHKQLNPHTAQNVKKVTQFREDGVESLREMVERMRFAKQKGIDNRVLPSPKKVYPEEKMKREMHYYEDTDNYKLPNKLVFIPGKQYNGANYGDRKKIAYKEKFGIPLKDSEKISKRARERAA
jgi:large subunit ribosomal protein L17